MNLRNLHRHVKNHDWFAVGVDFLIVVVGVFIGIQVANWNTGRIERRDARVYVERIREDIEISAISLHNRIDFYRHVRRHALAALDAFDEPRSGVGEQFLVDAFQAAQSHGGAVERSTYEEILSASAMNSIPDPEVRRRIARHYRNVSALEEIGSTVVAYWDNMLRLMPYPVQAAIRRQCSPTVSTESRGLPTITLPDHCDPEIAPELISAAVAAILDPELKMDLTRRIADLDTKLVVTQRLVDRGEAFDKFLSESQP